MPHDGAGFAIFFSDVMGGKATSLASYNVNLRKIDKAVGGIDEYIAAHGMEGFTAWLRENGEAAFKPYASNVRTAGNAYVRFRLDAQIPEGEAEIEATPEENAATVFKFERELQQAVRSQLSTLEGGLSEQDGGSEESFATGRSDILARDAQGIGVVIELKAGTCPKGAIEQALGYAQDWIESGESRVRVMVVAGAFTPRQRAAAKRIPDLQLKTYHLAVQFQDA